MATGNLSFRYALHKRKRQVTFDPNRLRKLRVKQRFTQRGMAALLRMAYQNYQNYEKPKAKGGYAPKGMRMQQIAKILDTTPEYLTGQTGDPTRITTEDLAEDELKLLSAYRRMNPKERNSFLLELFRKYEGGKS